jgi:PAS domain S-box-containing protein
MQENTDLSQDGSRIQELERELADARKKLSLLGKDLPAAAAIDPGEAARRYHLLASYSRDIILFVHRDSGQVLEANQAAVDSYGYTYEELKNLTIQDLRAPSTHKEIPSQVSAASQVGAVFETLHMRKDGSTFPVEVSSRGVEVGGEPALLSVIRDIRDRKKAEAALKKSEALYRTIVRSIPQSAIWVVDHDLRYLVVEGSLPAEFGFDREKLEGLSVFEGMEEQISTRVEPYFRQALAGDACSFETHYAGRYLETQFTPLFDEEGQIFAALAVTLDLTERKREEERLREDEERLRLAYEAAGLGTWDWQPGNRYSINNDIYFKIHGLEPHPEGKVEFGSYLDLVHPDDRERLRLTVNRASTGEMVVDLPFRFIRPDGQVRWIQSYRRNFFEDGRLVRQIGAVRDITDQVRYEEDLRAANEALQAASQSLKQTFEELQKGEERFRLLVDSLEDFVFTLDLDQRHTGLYGRSLARYGITPEQFIGRTPIELMGEEIAQAHVQANWRALQGENVIYEWSVPQGENLFYFQTKLSPLRDERGQITGIVGVGRDITDKKRVEQDLAEYARKLERSNQELQEFAYVASHDLQEPLRKIRFFAENLSSLEEEKLDPTSRDYLRRMQASVERMQKMIFGLLDLSRVSTQGLPFSRVDLKVITSEAVSDLEMYLLRSGGSVVIEDLPEIQADPVQMRRLFQNLIGNALKYHRDKVPPEVRVRTVVPEGEDGRSWVRILIEDNGIGFHMDKLERIFQPFQRLHGKGKYEGTGMGLAICKKIVERHGGQLTAESSPGLGSTFIIDLPLIPPFSRSSRGKAYLHL